MSSDQETTTSNTGEEPMDVGSEPSAATASNNVKMESEERVEYRLSRIFSAHKQDVKCVLGTPMGAIVTASRDEKLKIWTERGGTYCETACMHPAERMAVNSAAFYQRPAADGGQWYLFTGLKNGLIHVYEGAAAQPLAVLREHYSNVCVLHVDVERRVLLSGSWDSRALAWPVDEILSGAMSDAREGSCWELLPRHTHSVWALASVPGATGGYLTGSADTKIMLHSVNGSQQSKQALSVFAGHKDVVRALVVLSPHHFLSAANDSTVRLWAINGGGAGGQCLQVVNSTGGEYLYALSPINAGHYVVSAGEGGYFDVWRVEEAGATIGDSADSKEVATPQITLHQSLRLPAQSIWSVAESARNGDVALATSTGQVYIYSSNKARWAGDELLQSFDAEFTAVLAKEIQAQMNSEQDKVTINVALDDGQPTLKLEYVKGTNPAIAAEEFIKANQLPISYLNEITDYIKANVPEARLAEAINYRRQPMPADNGEESFDHSMEVRLNKDGPALQLGFNLGEQPELAAQRFLEKNKLPVKFLSHLSALVSDQMSELQFGAGSSYVDPFTGGGRYVPGGGSSTSNGGSRSTPSTKPVKSHHLPLADYFLFPVAENATSTTKALAKLHEMNSLQVDELRLEEAELTAIEEIMTTKEFYATEAHLIALEKGALHWHIDTILPLMDAFRLALLNKEVNEHFCGAKDRATTTLQRLSVLLISDPAVPLKVFICRALSNAFAHEAGKNMVMSDVNGSSKLLSQQIGGPIAKPLVEIAAASALANIALTLYRQSENEKVAELGPREDALRAIIARLESIDDVNYGQMSSVAVARLLQAMGTLMWGDGSVVALARSKELGKRLPRLKDSFSETEVKELCNDISAMLLRI